MYFPLFVDLSEKNILFIGGGEVASRRIDVLYDFAGHISVIAPHIHETVKRLAEQGTVSIIQRSYDEGDIGGSDIVFACTGNREKDAEIAAACRQKGIPVNAASDRTLCDFYFPGIVRDDPVVIGVTASGEDHSLAAGAAAKIRDILKKEETPGR